MKKNRILIVDDNEENLNVLGNFLASKNYIVQFANNGKQAIKYVNYKRPDLILLDISMPEISGYDVCNILKKDENTTDIPIIFITAYSETENIVKALRSALLIILPNLSINPNSLPEYKRI